MLHHPQNSMKLQTLIADANVAVMNARRILLIDKYLAETITAEEARELDGLKAAFRRYVEHRRKTNGPKEQIK